MTPELAFELVKAGGIPALAIAWVIMHKSKTEASTVTKEDPAVKLVSELRAIADRQIRIEAMLERILDR